MARSRDSRRRRTNRLRKGRAGSSRSAARAAPAAAPRPTRAAANAETAADPPTASANASAADATGLPARPRRQIQAQRPTTSDAPRVHSLFYRLTHPRAILAIIDELRRVVWPTRQETGNLTVVVLVVAIAIGIFLGAIDFGLNRVVENALLP